VNSMGDNSPIPKQRERTLGTTAIALGTATMTLVLLSAMPLYTMTQTPPVLRFFDPRRPPTREEGWLVSMMDYALSSSEKNDVVIFGDSACRAAVDPLRFESLTRMRAYNLGILGDLGPDVRLNLAQAYLSRHPLPRLVVLCISPVGMERDVLEQWTLLHDRCLDCYGFDPEGFPGRLAYLIRQGTLLDWDHVLPPPRTESPDIRDRRFEGREDEPRETYRMLDSASGAGRGFVPLWGNKYARRLVRKQDLVLVNPVWYAGVRRLAEACQRAGVPLLIHFVPIPADGSERLNFEQVEKWLQDVRSAFPNVIIVNDHEIPRYPRELMWDTTHINADGAAKFTATLADVVRTAIDPAGNPKKN
jgi:hypothetical protein